MDHDTAMLSVMERPDSVALAEAASSWASAYVHLPFCARVCPYCDFAVVAGRDDLQSRYLQALAAEIEREPDWRPLHSIYIGGGTPSRTAPESLGHVVERISSRFGIVAGAEISLEANPEDWSTERAEQLLAAGFNRVSLGVQSFDPGVLRSLGRAHDPETAAMAIEVARRAGFSSINLDLIYGTPGESAEVWRTTLEAAIAVSPDHVSCYSLTVEKGTELQRQVRAGAPAPDPDLQADQFDMATEVLEAAGLVRYEVSNWARPGHHCRYNLAVWGQAEYLAFGMGAHRFRDGVRAHNLSRLDAYLEAIESGRTTRRGEETLTGWEAEVERVFVGLRRRAGVQLGAAGLRLLESEGGHRLVEAGVIAVSNDRLIIERPLLTDAVLRELLALPIPDC